MRTRVLLATAAVVAIAAGVGIAYGLGHNVDDTKTSTAAPTTTASTETSEATPGFGDPITDLFGRKVMVPNNPAGSPLTQREPGTRTECAATAPVSSPESVMIQRSFEMPILASATDGPARLDGTVLAGYRHSPQGAALAGWNWVARVTAGGAPAHDTAAAMTALSDAERATLATPSAKPGAAQWRNATSAPDAFRVSSCDSDFVAIEFAGRQPADQKAKASQTSWVGLRLNLLWRDGDWKVQTLSDPQLLGSGQHYSALDVGWTRWAF